MIKIYRTVIRPLFCMGVTFGFSHEKRKIACGFSEWSAEEDI